MNPSQILQFALLALALGSVLAVAFLIVLLFFLVLGSRLSILLRLLRLFPRVVPALQVISQGLDFAALGAEDAGFAAKSAGEFLRTSGGVLDSLQIPNGSLQTRSLWDWVAKPPGAPDVYVLTSLQLSMDPLFPTGSPVTNAGNNVVDLGTRLGPRPSQPGTLSGELHNAAQVLKDFVQTLASLQP